MNDTAIMLILMKHLAYSMRDIDWDWDQLTEDEKEAFESQETFEKIRARFDEVYPGGVQ